jgi:CheY-specific phosphatase CheX
MIRASMSAETARQIVAKMNVETPKAARIALYRAALSPLGNLSHEAKQIYKQALDADVKAGKA